MGRDPELGSVVSDIAAICHPMPVPGEVPDDVYSDVCDFVHAAREEMARNLEAGADADYDMHEPLLSAIGAASSRKEHAEAEIRRLIAYGRETDEACGELRRAFETHPRLDVIRAASGEHDHDRNLWCWAEGPWWDAVDDLDGFFCHIVDVHV